MGVASSAGYSEGMKLRVDFDVDGPLLLAVVTGTASFDDSWHVLKEICDTALEKQVNRILIDGLAVQRVTTAFERYNLGVKLVAYCGAHEFWPKLALVGQSPVIDGFGTVVARNRGLFTEVFPNRMEALEWLRTAPK